MSKYVVDASVAVKWLVDEQFSNQAATLLASGKTLLAPDLLFAEATNALWAMQRRGDIGMTDYSEAVAVLRAAPVGVPATMRHLAAAAGRLAADLDHPVYDCLYLALGIQEQCPVVTADRRFHEAVDRHPYLSDKIVHVRGLPSA